ncbi:hypothetical protein BN946_scf185006.g8 [Trametes cinnabarina]|uniref:alpha-galactosidase n=1 Tax=Pycnoporus cinnabarinus TaxID=5643 RepID=A0A060SRZ3_PYCCI|nr:hypothetical protein BN946_scf185006.g8 [Trametes cinnabarina]
MASSLLLASLLSAWSVLSPDPPLVQALDNRVAKFPVLGYNTWNAYHCDINETLILQAAQYLVSLGLAVCPLSPFAPPSPSDLLTLQHVGYTHVNIDDCYAEKNRSPSGDILASPYPSRPPFSLPHPPRNTPTDAQRFPSGMNNLTHHIHNLGLKAGIVSRPTPSSPVLAHLPPQYSDSGWFTCQLYPGSFQNEARQRSPPTLPPIRSPLPVAHYPHTDDRRTLFQDWGFDYLK